MHLTITPTHRPALRLPAVPLNRVSLPAVLLTAVYLAAVAVAVTAPREQAFAGLVVLAGLTARLLVRRHRSAAVAVPGAVTVVDAPAATALAPAPATAA